MRNVRFFNPGLAYKKIRREMLGEIDRVLKAGDLILRDDVDKFEKSFAKLVGTKYAVAVNSGTDALLFALKAAGVGEGSRVLTNSYTFWATIEAIIHCGAVPVFDVSEPYDFFLPVHMEGNAQFIPQDISVPIIEDACQGLTSAPVTGLAACYSFYPAKILGAYGDAGAVATNDEKVAEFVRQARNHGGKPTPFFAGYNSRMDNLQAAILNVKLKYIKSNLARRKEIARMYDHGLKGIIKIPPPRKVYQDYVAIVEHRDELYGFLKKNGIETMLNEYHFSREYQKTAEVEEYEKNTLRFPCNDVITNSEVNYVIKQVKAFYAGK